MFRHLWWILGLALMGSGVAMGLSTQAGQADVGWFAYTPSSSESEWHMGWGDPLHHGSVLIVSWWQLVGYGVAAFGLAILAAGIGFQLGRRGANPPEQS